MDYVLSMEALMHTMPGLKPGYLPERDAHYLLSRVRVPLHSFTYFLINFSGMSLYCVTPYFSSPPHLGFEYVDSFIIHGEAISTS